MFLLYLRKNLPQDFCNLEKCKLVLKNVRTFGIKMTGYSTLVNAKYVNKSSRLEMHKQKQGFPKRPNWKSLSTRYDFSLTGGEILRRVPYL